MMLWRFTENILSGRPIPIFNNGEMWRDFTDIDDIVTGVLACLSHPPADDGTAKPGGSVSPHALYNIGNNRPERLLDVVDLIEQACGRPAVREFLPMQPGDVLRTYADIDAMTRDFGYRPGTTVAEGIPRFVQWYREYHRL